MARTTTNEADPRFVARKAVTRAVGAWIVLPAFFLVTGGSLAWWEAWAYCAVLLLPMTFFVAWAVRRDPAFLARRLETREKEKTQRYVQLVGLPAFVATLLIPGLDHRFGWSEPPMAAVIAALAASLAGYLFVIRVFLENRWAGRTVETSSEQRVVSTGPYALVRHPMYVGVTVLYVATPVALGSYWAILPALAVVAALVLRIRNEEAVLVRDLPGYEEYRRAVRWRLVPRVW